MRLGPRCAAGLALAGLIVASLGACSSGDDDSSSDVDGMPVTRHMIEPSCSCGMNSLPRNGNSARLANIAMPATITTTPLRASERSSNG